MFSRAIITNALTSLVFSQYDAKLTDGLLAAKAPKFAEKSTALWAHKSLFAM